MKRCITGLLIVLITAPAIGQHRPKTHHKPAPKPVSKVVKQPITAITSVNYAYYDASKGGYIFMEDGKQSFLPALPIMPDNMPTRTSVPLTKKLNLDLYPQLHYPNNKLVHPDQNSN